MYSNFILAGILIGMLSVIVCYSAVLELSLLDCLVFEMTKITYLNHPCNYTCNWYCVLQLGLVFDIGF